MASSSGDSGAPSPARLLRNECRLLARSLAGLSRQDGVLRPEGPTDEAAPMGGGPLTGPGGPGFGVQGFAPPRGRLGIDRRR